MNVGVEQSCAKRIGRQARPSQARAAQPAYVNMGASVCRLGKPIKQINKSNTQIAEIAVGSFVWWTAAVEKDGSE